MRPGNPYWPQIGPIKLPRERFGNRLLLNGRQSGVFFAVPFPNICLPLRCCHITESEPVYRRSFLRRRAPSVLPIAIQTWLPFPRLHRYQAGEAVVWRDAICGWIYGLSGIPDAKGRLAPSLENRKNPPIFFLHCAFAPLPLTFTGLVAQRTSARKYLELTGKQKEHGQGYGQIPHHSP